MKDVQIFSNGAGESVYFTISFRVLVLSSIAPSIRKSIDDLSDNLKDNRHDLSIFSTFFSGFGQVMLSPFQSRI